MDATGVCLCRHWHVRHRASPALPINAGCPAPLFPPDQLLSLAHLRAVAEQLQNPAAPQGLAVLATPGGARAATAAATPGMGRFEFADDVAGIMQVGAAFVRQQDCNKPGQYGAWPAQLPATWQRREALPLPNCVCYCSSATPIAPVPPPGPGCPNTCLQPGPARGAGPRRLRAGHHGAATRWQPCPPLLVCLGRRPGAAGPGRVGALLLIHCCCRLPLALRHAHWCGGCHTVRVVVKAMSSLTHPAINCSAGMTPMASAAGRPSPRPCCAANCWLPRLPPAPPLPAASLWAAARAAPLLPPRQKCSPCGRRWQRCESRWVEQEGALEQQDAKVGSGHMQGKLPGCGMLQLRSACCPSLLRCVPVCMCVPRYLSPWSLHLRSWARPTARGRRWWACWVATSGPSKSCRWAGRGSCFLGHCA